MRKKWTITLSLLALSTALVGCNTSKPETEGIISPIEEPMLEDTMISNETLDPVEAGKTDSMNTVDANDSPLDSEESIEDKEMPSEHSDKNSASNTGSSTNLSTQTKPDSSSKPSTQTKPDSSSKPSTQTKPDSSSQPSTQAKPDNSSQPSTQTKPDSSSKPSTQTKPDSSSKPNTPSEPEKPSIEPTKPDESPKPTPDTSTTVQSCSAILTQIAGNMDASQYQDMDATLLQDFYGIDTSLLEDFSVKMPMMSFSITEVGVFKVKDINNINTVISSINKRADNIGMMLYPSLQETFNNRKVVTQGEYILFAISEDADTIVANFNALF